MTQDLAFGRSSSASRGKLLPYDPVKVAWHEAGHVLISQILGIRAESATIVPNDASGRHGAAVHETPLDFPSRWDAWRGKETSLASAEIAQAMVCMAGFEAQRLRPRRKGQRSPRNQPSYRRSMDNKKAVWLVFEAAKHLGRSSPFPLYYRLLKMTRGLVRRHRDDIARVAGALLRHGELQWDDIESLVPLRRWPAAWPRDDVSLRPEQMQRLLMLIRSPHRRLSTVLAQRTALRAARPFSLST
jgi:hypothetical protein